jgi:hypothetical protein
VLDWFFVFALTLAVETPIAWLLLRRLEPVQWRLLLKIFFANLATHPLVWYAFPQLPLGRRWTLAMAELFAVVAEAFFYLAVIPKLRLWRALGISLLLNLASFGAGLALQLLVGWP